MHKGNTWKTIYFLSPFFSLHCVYGPNGFYCNQIFFPLNAWFRGLFFHHSLWKLPFVCLLDDVEHTEEINMLLCMWGLTFTLCMLQARCIQGPLLVFGDSGLDWGWQPCTISCYRNTQMHGERWETSQASLESKASLRMHCISQSSRLCRGKP